MDGKRADRAALLAEMGLAARDDEPVLGVVTRMADQKGMDLLADVAGRLPAWRARLIVLGSGDASLEQRFRTLAAEMPDHVAVRIGYDEPLSRRIYAGSDAVVVPSRFEPCGLTQMYAMRYGTVPIAHAIGGLRDTVIDRGDDALVRGDGTGICFEYATADGLAWAIGRACDLYRRDPAGWRRASASIMEQDVSWDRSAALTLALYRDVLGHGGGPR
jgi:starch synthase